MDYHDQPLPPNIPHQNREAKIGAENTNIPSSLRSQQHSTNSPRVSDEDPASRHGSVSPEDQNTGSNKRNSVHDGLLMTSTDDPEEINGEMQSKKRISKQKFRYWAWEIGACFLSLVSILSLVILLYFENDKPLEQWPWIISPTVVVSFVAAIAKSSMLLAVTEVLGQLKWHHFHGKANPLIDLQIFDAASRGPLGAVELLLRKHFRAVSASLAAIIVVAALFIDPFMQLIFTFPYLSRLEPNAKGLFNQTHTFDPKTFSLSGKNADNGNSFGTFDPYMQSEIIRALYPQLRQPLTVACPTANCVWPQVTTLGICTSCANVTQQVNISCPGRQHNSYQCNYGMPSGQIINAYVNAIPSQMNNFITRWNSTSWPLGIPTPPRLGTAVGGTFNGTFHGSFPRPSSVDKGFPATLAYIEGVLLKAVFEYNDIDSLDVDSIFQRPSAWACTIAFCTKTYERLAMVHGKMDVSEPVEEPLVLSGDVTELPIPVGNNPKFSSHSIDGLRRNSSSSSVATHWIDEYHYKCMATYLSSLFSTSWKTVGSEPLDYTSYSSNMGWVFSAREGPTQTLRDITDAITEMIRNSENSTPVVGEAFRAQYYIHVRWGWIAPPLVLAILSLTLVVSMVIRTNRSALPIWKSSSIPLLFHNVDGWVPDSEALKGSSELERGMKGISVKLPKDSGDLTFKRD